MKQGDSPRDSGVRHARPGHRRAPCSGAGAGLFLCLSLRSHRSDFLPASWGGRKQELTRGSQDTVTAILFKRISLFVIFIRDVIDCG